MKRNTRSMTAQQEENDSVDDAEGKPEQQVEVAGDPVAPDDDMELSHCLRAKERELHLKIRPRDQDPSMRSPWNAEWP